jgi:two-component system, cell cycle response regulator DivK
MENSGLLSKESIQNKYVWTDKVILVAEDIDLNFLYISELLKPTGVTIIHSINGKQAVEQCQNEARIDMVLMDIYMPVMNGYEATRQIKALQPELPVIAQTAYAMSEDRNRAMEAGCDDFIAKPIGKDELLSKIDRFFQKVS